jgi:signal transduction histidine kinase
MSLKFKLSALVVLVCTLLGLFVGYLLWHSWQIRRKANDFIPALSYLCSIADARSWMTRQAKEGLDYLMLDEPMEKQEYDRAAHQVAAAFFAWQEAIEEQQQLGIPGEEEDLEQVLEIRARYAQWQTLNDELFATMHKAGRSVTIKKYVETIDRNMTDYLYVALDDAIEDGLDEVEDAYQTLLLALGSAPWTAQMAASRLQVTQATIDYLVAASRLSTAVNRQVSVLMDYLYAGDEEKRHTYIRMEEETIAALANLDSASKRRLAVDNRPVDPAFFRLQDNLQQVIIITESLILGRQAGLTLVDLREKSEELERLLDGELVPCLVRTLHQGSSDLQTLTRAPHDRLVLAVAILCVIVAGSALQMIRSLSASLSKLRKGMEQVADGDFGYRIGMMRKDEIGVLGRVFDQMVERLQTTRRELEDLYRRMEKKVDERTQQLQLANRELESFNYSVSHDLRGDLTQISGLAQIMISEGANIPDAEAQVFRERICLASARMARTIDGLLKLSHLSGKDIDHTPINLSSIVQEVAAELQKREPKRVVQFHIEPDIIVLGDETLLRLAMENLLGNAWKYTGDEEAARIEFGVQKTNGKITCFIRDNGIGFDTADAERIFLPFQRLDNAVKIPGEGVGLATVQRVILRHGGEIHAQGAPGAGATFLFTLSMATIGD